MNKTVWTRHSKPVPTEEKSNQTKVGKFRPISKEGKNGNGEKKALDVRTAEAFKVS
jgi:hypothetical protein